MSLVSKYIKQLSCHESTLRTISLINQKLTDAELTELVDCLLAHPNVVTHVHLGFN